MTDGINGRGGSLTYADLLAYYERFGVAEYWFANLDEGRILAFRLEDGRCAGPQVFTRGDLLESKHLQGFTAPADKLLALSLPGHFAPARIRNRRSQPVWRKLISGRLTRPKGLR